MKKDQGHIVGLVEASTVSHSSARLLASGRLTGQVQHPTELAPAQRDRMYALLVHYFNNVTWPQFEHDLAEKEWVITLTDVASGQIQGFSTLMRLRVVVGNRPVVAFFSGDTIIHRDYWGETELPRLWARHVFGLAETIHDAQVYWFLISSGYKTYRFLPVFFREFYPTYQSPTPAAIKQVLDALGQLKFPNEYDAARGLIHFTHPSPLRPGVAKVTQRRLKDPHVAFFVAANPGHARGDQLACLVELTLANLTTAGRRLLNV
jgi:hypothetical protein